MATETHKNGKLRFANDNELSPNIAYIRSGTDWGSEVAVCYSVSDDKGGTENARRLVACWNACEGISTDILAAEPTSLNDLINGLRTDRDELMEALREATSIAMALVVRFPEPTPYLSKTLDRLGELHKLGCETDTQNIVSNAVSGGTPSKT
jgi:hypothetical protein